MQEPIAPAPLGEPVTAGLRYLDRELSWLDFDARVLALAEDRTVPVLERARFLAIFSQNLDEFFMTRVAGLADRLAAGLGAAAAEGLHPLEGLEAIRARTLDLVARQTAVFRDELVPALAEGGIVLSDWDGLDDNDRKGLSRLYEERVFPVLTPLAVDPGHPFPYISNLSLNLAVFVGDAAASERRFARVKVPPLLSRFLVTADGGRFVPLEQVIAAHLPGLFPGMEIESHHAFRVTRNTDIMLEEEDDADDLLAAVEIELRRRRFGQAVRLEVDPAMSEEVLELLMRELEIGPNEVYVVDGPLELGGLSSVYELNRPDLKYEPCPPVTSPPFSEKEPVDVFSALRQRDVLVHHPYESFTTSVEAFIQQAASDPRVLAIKQTLYRTSGDSPIGKALIAAAERGKQVVALVEVKARFDEESNIAWARALEEAGVHVVYGLVGLKTGSKTALVVRQEDDGIHRYCHIGTGNYNPVTARLYEDIGLFTADPDIGADLTDLFNFLTGYSRRTDYRKLVVAPIRMRERIRELIDEAASEKNGRIVMKMNNLIDEAVIDALYDASNRGCEIDLVVRGICRLRPETPGLSERIRVRSIHGRYLEHSRIFAFGNGAERPVRYFISSADLTPSNFDRRIQVLSPVADRRLAKRLQQVLDVNLADDTRAWRLRSDGSWRKVPTVAGIDTHARLREAAAAG
jgi:polyphosphate kinase